MKTSKEGRTAITKSISFSPDFAAKVEARLASLRGGKDRIDGLTDYVRALIDMDIRAADKAEKESALRDSNPRPLPCEGIARTDSLSECGVAPLGLVAHGITSPLLAVPSQKVSTPLAKARLAA